MVVLVKKEKKKRKKKETKDARSLVASIIAVTAVLFYFSRCLLFPGYKPKGLEARMISERYTGKESLPGQVLAYNGTYRGQVGAWSEESSVAYSGRYLARPSATSRVFTLEYQLEKGSKIVQGCLHSYFFFEIFYRQPVRMVGH